MRGVKRPPRVVSGGGPDPIDFGLVGDIVGFDERLLELLGDAGYVPVLACLAADGAGQVLNVNADEVFLTGTAAEITPVREIDHRRIGGGEWPITRGVQDAFFQVVKGADAKHDHWLHFV